MNTWVMHWKTDKDSNRWVPSGFTQEPVSFEEVMGLVRSYQRHDDSGEMAAYRITNQATGQTIII